MPKKLKPCALAQQTARRREAREFAKVIVGGERWFAGGNVKTRGRGATLPFFARGHLYHCLLRDALKRKRHGPRDLHDGCGFWSGGETITERANGYPD